jgi:hypothetical protein
MMFLSETGFILRILHVSFHHELRVHRKDLALHLICHFALVTYTAMPARTEHKGRQNKNGSFAKSRKGRAIGGRPRSHPEVETAGEWCEI